MKNNVNFKMTISKVTTIKLIKISKDNTIKEIFVNDTLVEKDGDGNYIAEVEESNIEAIVKVVANNEYASIQIEENAQEIKQSEKTVELSKEKYTNVLIKVTSQNGEIMQETLTIKKVSDDNTINTVLVDGIECKNYDETTKTYTAYIDAKNDEVTLSVIANSNYATVVVNKISNIGNVITDIDTTNEITKVEMMVKSETGKTEKY